MQQMEIFTSTETIVSPNHLIFINQKTIYKTKKTYLNIEIHLKEFKDVIKF